MPSLPIASASRPARSRAPCGRLVAPLDPAHAVGALRPSYPPHVTRLTPSLAIIRPASPRPFVSALTDTRETLEVPAIVAHYFPGRFEARPLEARISTRGLMRWVVGLIRDASLFPVLEDDWIDAVEEEHDLTGEEGEDACYVHHIPAEGGYPYEWRRVVDDVWTAPGPAEALLYVICGNPTSDDEDEGNPIADVVRRVRRALSRPGMARLSGRVHALARAALATSRRYTPRAEISGFDHALTTDLGGVFARHGGALAGVPTLAAVMARATGNCFLDIDRLSWCEMGYEAMPWTLGNVRAFATEWAEARPLMDTAYEGTLGPLRDDPSLFAPLVAALEETLALYGAYTRERGQPDPAVRRRPMPAERRRVRRRRRRCP